MAKMFYTSQEAAHELNKSEDELKDLVREGKLREFRDAGKVNYKVEDIDSLRQQSSAPSDDIPSASEDSGVAGASASGEILLEPVEDSSIELAPAPGDVVSLDESGAGATASGATAIGKSKGDTVVPSVGVNVFDDDELDEQVDPLAQTAVTDLAGLGIDGIGSGSGILDLTRESDDTSLGRELLDEIYTEGETDEVKVGDATRAGLDQAAAEDTVEADEELAIAEEAEPGLAPPRAVVREVVEYGPDPLSSGLTASLAVAVAVMWIAGLAVVALVRGIIPAPLQSVYANLWMYAAGAVGVSLLVAGVSYFLAKRSS